MAMNDVFREQVAAAEEAEQGGLSPQEQALFGNDQVSDQGQVPEGQAELQPPDPNQTRVPLRALEEERHKRQAFQQQLEEYKQREAALAGRLQGFHEAQQQVAAAQQQQYQEPVPEAPDPEQDPVGFQAWRNDQLEAEIHRLREEQSQVNGAQAQLNQQAMQRIEADRILQQSRDFENSFSQQQPDYRQAADYVIAQKKEQWMLTGMNEQEANAMLENERLLIVNQAIQKNDQGQFVGWKHNPAERVYQIAQQMGYVAPGTPPADPHQQAVQGQFPTQQQAQQTPVQPQQPALSAADRAAMARQGQAQARTGAGTAMTNDGPLTLEDLRNMPEGEFARLDPALVDHLLGK